MPSGAQLFELPALPATGDEPNAYPWQALGTAAEYMAIGILLERGHKVATPVTDDDGVDLIVDYRTKVQVKSSASRSPTGLLRPKMVTGAGRYSLRDHVDVFVIRARDTQQWWVVPRAVLTAVISRGTDAVHMGHSMDQWLDAWDVFDAPN